MSSPMKMPMTVSPAVSASLKTVGDAMVESHDPWWIIASAAVALHGADPGHVVDVDVLMSVPDARRILPSIGIELRHGSAHAAFRSSVFGTWNGTVLPVEFMAGFHRRSGEAWLPVLPVTRRPVEIHGVLVFVPERLELGNHACRVRPTQGHRACPQPGSPDLKIPDRRSLPAGKEKLVRSMLPTCWHTQVMRSSMPLRADRPSGRSRSVWMPTRSSPPLAAPAMTIP